MRRLTLALLLSAALAPLPAWAKKVSLEWKEIRGAKGYEVQIERGGRTVLTKKIEDITWSGNLEFGVYSYQIRGIDRAGRPGRWSEARPLVVMPAAPPPQSPLDDATVTLYSADARVFVKWFEVQGISKYLLEVKRGKKVIYHDTIKGSEAILKGLPPGDYSWQVTPIIEASGRVPASIEGKVWEGTPSKKRDFTIERGKLAEPVPVLPLGAVPPPRKGKLELEWKKVAGAEGYEVEVDKKKFTTSDTSLTVDSPGEGNHTWRVRALANIDPVRKEPDSIGPQSTAAFKIDPNAKFFDGAGYVALSSMFAPYTYQGISPANGFSGKASSVALTGRASGEYYFHPLWGVGAGADLTQFTFGTQNFNRMTIEATLKYRMTLSEGEYGWFLSPKIGFEMRDYFMLVPSLGSTVTAGQNVSISSQQSNAKGAQVGFDLRKQFSRKFSLGIKFSYFKPLTISGSGIGALTGDASNRNMNFGAQALYWFGARWGMGIGGYIDKRSISYTSSQSQTGDTRAEQVFMDGTYFFGSLIYSWR